MTKMLACGTRISGVKEYGYDNPGCQHVKYITNVCHSRVCPSCGKKPPTCGYRHFLRHPYVRKTTQLASPRSCLCHLRRHQCARKVEKNQLP
ncbi:transposase zinc-binding domain-containing protein [Erwinia tracheiphila]|nr:transposase zinc-binding domain-containing protein [Erwinia tracheiphila]UIA98516.1 transposase zinc-binding domain-containing protein [Erwinia tracheiphila]